MKKLFLVIAILCSTYSSSYAATTASTNADTMNAKPVTTIVVGTTNSILPKTQNSTVGITSTIPAGTSSAGSSGWHPFGMFSKNSDNAKPAPAPSAPTTTVSKPPDNFPTKPTADPEQVLRGKVWKSESACAKEALSGKCTSIDCATHTGGACSDQTGIIWIYR